MNTTHPTPDLIQDIVEVAVDDAIPNFSMDANWYEHYAMDSLGAVALQMEVYRRLGVRIPEQRMPEIRTGQQLTEVVLELQAVAADTAAQKTEAAAT